MFFFQENTRWDPNLMAPCLRNDKQPPKSGDKGSYTTSPAATKAGKTDGQEVK